jgi:competence transcription factor ComK
MRNAISHRSELVNPMKKPPIATPVTPSSTIILTPTLSAMTPAGNWLNPLVNEKAMVTNPTSVYVRFKSPRIIGISGFIIAPMP